MAGDSDNHSKVTEGVATGLETEGSTDKYATPVRERKSIGCEVDSVWEEELPDRRETDYKHKQVFGGWMLIWLAYQSTGVIYGDIGTSPLYVYSSTFSSNPSYDDLLGALSLIIWSLTLIVTVKYVCIVLFADDEGEGGTFAMYNLLSRYCNIARPDPKSLNTLKMERFKSTDMHPTNLSVRSFIENSKISHAMLKVLAVFGVSLIMADGILTPAQSVLGAIQGLTVVSEGISVSTIVGVSCAILVLLYLIQPLGITKLSSAFAPVVIIWLTFNLAFGIYNLIYFDHSVLKAFSPYFAGLYFIRNRTEGWKSLGGILLAFTGVEALFADIGAFTAKAVRIGWLGLAYPCLLLAYIGQAAYISVHPEAHSNPFFSTVPPGMLYPSLVIAILAAIVASQALITSTFQLLSQVMQTSYFPHVNMIYTSDKFHGQVYIPMANWLMMVGTVIVTAVYNNTTSLGNAYGTCVILVTFITTIIISIVALVVWRMHWLLVLVVWLPFITLDGLFLSSALTKVPKGAWFTLLLSVILSSIFVLWRYGKEKQWASEGRGRREMNQMIVKNSSGQWSLPASMGNRQLNPIKGIAIFFDKGGEGVPTVYEEFIRKFEALPEIQVLLHLRALPRPYAADDEKFVVSRTSVPNCYRIIARHGYNDVVITENLGEVVYGRLRQFLLSSPARAQPQVGLPGESVSADDSIASPAGSLRLVALEEAWAAQTVYIVGKEQLRLVKTRNNFIQRVILNVFLWIRDNTRAKVASMKIPIDKLVEVGFVKEI